jgi:hypothetical protein
MSITEDLITATAKPESICCSPAIKLLARSTAVLHATPGARPERPPGAATSGTKVRYAIDIF